ncbi:MAG: RNA polymerase sigma-70 factor [Chitinophagaceae bacterium]|nr:RNA polymerase sigma-70 factor [Chitinophagaceae bacterium]
MIKSENIEELQQRIALYDDMQAYRQLFFVFYSPLVKFATGFVNSHEQAEEIVSDVFTKIWEKRASLNTIANLRVYLYISTKNTSLNYIAKHRRVQNIGLDDIDIDLPSATLNPEQLMITAEVVNRVDAAIKSLPPRCKLIFKLIREDGLPYKEVAEVLNISVNTIDNQLAIAIKKIALAINLRLNRKIGS